MPRFQKPWPRLVLCGNGEYERVTPPKTLPELKIVLLKRSRPENRGYHSPCRIWVGSKDSCGYGVLRFLGKNRKTTRLMWLAESGELPPDRTEVCHKCDQPGCIEKTHLFIASHWINMQDAKQKNRLNKAAGITHYCCSFTEDQVRELKRMFLNGLRVTKQLASKYCVSPAALNKIRTGKSWKHIKI